MTSLGIKNDDPLFICPPKPVQQLDSSYSPLIPKLGCRGHFAVYFLLPCRFLCVDSLLEYFLVIIYPTN